MNISMQGASVRVVDPQGRNEGEALLPGVVWEDDPYRAVTEADALVILTEWNEFRGLNLSKMAKLMTHAALADLRNIYDAANAQNAGFEAYVSIGRENFGLD